MLKLFLTVIKIFLVYVSVVRDSSQCMMVYVPSAAGTLSGLQTERVAFVSCIPAVPVFLW